MSGSEEPVAWLRQQIEGDGRKAAKRLRRAASESFRFQVAERLARAKAELAILDEHKAVANFCGDWLECAACGPNNDGSVLLAAPGEGESFYPCTTVRLLADGYKYRPGYRKEDWQAA